MLFRHQTLCKPTAAAWSCETSVKHNTTIFWLGFTATHGSDLCEQSIIIDYVHGSSMWQSAGPTDCLAQGTFYAI